MRPASLTLLFVARTHMSRPITMTMTGTIAMNMLAV
jgi:hypothetical protein